METNSNWNTIQGHWNDYKGRIKERWGRLTDSDLTQIEGHRDRLIGLLQTRYGIARDQVEQQVNDFISSAQNWLEEAKQKVAEFAEQGKEYFEENSFKDMAADVRDLMVRYPVQSALIGLGVGYLIGRVFTAGNRS
jgi:uncharacterized protein YjbJ (UPF0337 family)